MKKTIFSLVIMVVINFTGKGQTLIDWTDPRVQNLYQEFKNDRTVIEMLNNCTVLPPNVLLLADSSKAYYEDRADGQVPAVFLPVFVNSEMIGVLHWGKLADGSGKTANGSKFVLAWRDYKTAIQYNPKPNGFIKCYDLNRGCVEFGRFLVKAGEVTEYIELTDLMHSGEKAIHPCDENKNGNVGYFECYHCMKEACKGSSQCSFLCDVTNLAARLIGRSWAGCNGSMRIACIIISLAY